MMIIHCQACRARFKLDESKIKGKGARIRCRKCGESIIVMKSEIPSAVPPPPDKPASPPGKELFDLRAELRTPEKPPPEPPRQEVVPPVESPVFREAVSRPGPPLEAKQPETPSPGERDAFAPEPVEPPAPPPPPPPSTMDDAVERLVHRDWEPEKTVPDAETFPSAPAEADADIESPLFHEREKEPAQPAEAGADIESPLFREGEEVPAQPAEAGADIESPLFREREEEPAQPAEAGEPPSPPDLPETPFTLELEKEEDLSFLREAGERSDRTPEDATRAEISIAPPPEGAEPDRESSEYLILDIDSADSLRKEDPPAGPPAGFDISDSLDHPVPSRAESLQDELAGLGEESPLEGASVPEPRTRVIPPPKPLETPERRDAGRRAPSSSGRPSVALLVLLFVTLAGAGAYLAFTKAGQETLRTIVPGLESFWLGGKDSGRPFLVGNLRGHFESSDSAGRLFVIRGDVTNQSQRMKSAIRIRAELLDADRRPITELTAYAGNVISDLRSADRKTIDDAMANRFGDALSNVDVEPGKSLAFMVVFFDPPEGVSEYRLEALEGE